LVRIGKTSLNPGLYISWAPLGRRTERFAWLRGEPALVVNIRKAATSKSAEGRFMKTKFTTLVLGSLVATSLALSAGPALARDGDRPNNAHPGFHSRDSHRPDSRDSVRGYPASRNPNWGWGRPAVRVPVPVYRPVPVPSYGYPAYGYPGAGPAYSQDLYRRLENAKRLRAYHMSQHASREQIAYDNLRIHRLERELGLIR
jgi:hypothetical protein